MTTPLSVSSTGLFAKRFVVMLDIDGEKKILRDVLARDVADLIEVVALHAQLRSEYLVKAAGSGTLAVQYFDDALRAFTELTDASWAQLANKRHVELRLRRPAAGQHNSGKAVGGHLSVAAGSGDDASVASVRGTGTTSAGNPGSTDHHAASPTRQRAVDYVTPPAALLSVASRRAQVVDFVRKVLVQQTPDLSRDALIRVCSAVAQRYQAAGGYSDAAMAAEGVEEELNVDLLLPLVKREVAKQLLPSYSHASSPPAVAAKMPPAPSPPPSSAATVTLSPEQAIRPSRTTPLGRGEAAMVAPSPWPRTAAVVDATKQPTWQMAGNATAAPLIRPQPASDLLDTRRSSAVGGPATSSSQQQHAAASQPHQQPPLATSHIYTLDDAEGFYDDASYGRRGRGKPPHGLADAATASSTPHAHLGGQHHQSAQLGSPHSPAAAQHSTFRTVRYVVSGAFPPPPAYNDPTEAAAFGGGAANVRVSLTVPRVIQPDDDVLITAHVVVRSSVSLSWWLCYGPQRITLNLDELYNRNCVKTFQVSETGLLLTVRRGTLVAGWDYGICLVASSDITGASASDQAQFRVSKFGEFDGADMPNNQQQVHSAPQRAATPSYDHRGPHQRTVLHDGSEYLPPTMRGTTSTHQEHLGGYRGDADDGGGSGPLGAVGSGQTPTTGDGQPLGGPFNSPAPAAASLSHRSGGGALSPTPRPRPDDAQRDQRARIGMTFQEQLKHFFLDEVQPLYRLCLRPNMRQETFASILKNVAQMYWFSRPADANLDAALQREVIERVKHEILEQRSSSSGGSSGYPSKHNGGGPPGTMWGAGGSSQGEGGASGINIPVVGLRPQYAGQVRR